MPRPYIYPEPGGWQPASRTARTGMLAVLKFWPSYRSTPNAAR
ncbi:hypothetical protein QMK17_15170 [Rhodococcus sp. G-MC3]|nr:hypothetical protein [Rhodococcus sp. G-MC3]MDJ0394664.1 hypothetical protein [Rhodococcus sp. G-MC3]